MAFEELEDVLGGVTTNGGNTEVGEIEDDDGDEDGTKEEEDGSLAEEEGLCEGLAELVAFADVDLADALVVVALSSVVVGLLAKGGVSSAAAFTAFDVVSITEQ